MWFLYLLLTIGASQAGKTYRKIPKISPRAYIFQRLFLRGLFLEGHLFGGAYLRREICVSKSIGLVSQLEVNLPFLLCFTLNLRANFQLQAPGGLIFGGAYFRILRYPLTVDNFISSFTSLRLKFLIPFKFVYLLCIIS